MAHLFVRRRNVHFHFIALLLMVAALAFVSPVAAQQGRELGFQGIGTASDPARGGPLQHLRQLELALRRVHQREQHHHAGVPVGHRPNSSSDIPDHLSAGREFEYGRGIPRNAIPTAAFSAV